MELSLHCLPLLSHLPRHQLRLFRYNHRRCSTFNDKWQPNQISKLNVKSEKLSDFLNMAEVETEAEAEKKEEALEGLKRHVKLGNEEEEADYVGDVSKLADNNPLIQSEAFFGVELLLLELNCAFVLRDLTFCVQFVEENKSFDEHGSCWKHLMQSN